MARFRKNTRPSIPSLRLEDGTFITDARVKAERLLSTFYRDDMLYNQRRIKMRFTPITPFDRAATLNLPFTSEELLPVLHGLRQTAPGPDRIHNLFLKHLPASGCAALLELLNLSFTSGIIPDSWNTSDVVPLLKMGKPRTLVDSYRPIALSAAPLKVLERLIVNRLSPYLAGSDILTEHQFGYRKGHSTADPLVIIATKASHALSSGKFMIVTFIDISRAFDGLWHEAISAKLKFAGVHGTLLTWIENILASRHFVLTLGTETASFRATCGTPQGSVLSPLLFRTVMDGMAKVVQPPSQAELYADDNTTVTVADTLQEANSAAQQALDSTDQYGKDWGLPISKFKTSFMVITAMPYDPDDVHLFLDGTPIQQVSAQRTLGLYLDRKLTFKQHVQYLRTCTVQSLNFLRRLTRTTWGASKHSILLIYKALIRSRLDYASVIYGFCASSLLKKVEVIQNTALRIATGLPYGTANSALQVECNIPPLRYRRLALAGKFFLKAKAFYTITWQEVLTLSRPQAAAQVTTPFNKLCSALHAIGEQDIFKQVDRHFFPATFVRPENVFFHINWLPLPKGHYTDTHLRTLALEKIASFPGAALRYTDGSKTSNMCGIGVFDPASMKGWYNRVSPFLCISTVELYAILFAVKRAALQEPGSDLVVVSDSQAALVSLKSVSSYTGLISEVYRFASHFRTLHFLWVPAHVGIPGNEHADNLANRASELLDTALVPAPVLDLHKKLLASIQADWCIKWEEETTGRVLFGVKCVPSPWYDPPELNRTECCVISALRCGRARLQAHRFRVNRSEHDRCPACGDTETLEHLFFECAAHTRERNVLTATMCKLSVPFQLPFLLGGTVQPKQVQLLLLKSTLAYIRDTVGYKRILGID